MVAQLPDDLEILVQMCLSYCTKLCITGHMDVLLAADLLHYFLLFGLFSGTAATAATGGKHQQGHSTYQ